MNPRPDHALPDVLVDPHAVDDAVARVRSRMFGRAPTRKIGRYAVGELVGRGATSVVYRAFDPELQRDVALKILSAGVAGRLQEARALAALQHPNVVQVFDVGMHEGRMYMALEFVSGPTLRSWMDGRPDWRDVVDVFVDVARGLAAVHDAGLVHGDVKPQNVVIADGDRVCLVDFGLASVDDPMGSGTARAAGTPAYMAPEQHAGDGSTPSSDQYALCVALYEALYATRPFEASTFGELVALKAGGLEPSANSSVALPRALVRTVHRGLSPHSSDRWPSMHELIEALEQAREDGRALRPGLVAWVGLAAVVVVGAAVVWSWAADSRAPPIAQSIPAEPHNDPQTHAAFEESAAAVAQLLDAGEHERARDALRSIEQGTKGEPSPVASATVGVLQARLALADGDAGASLSRGRQAFFEARDQGSAGRTVAFDAAMVAAKAAQRLSQIETGLTWVRHAESLRASLSTRPIDDARILAAKAMLEFSSGKLEASLANGLEALRRYEEASVEDSGLALDALAYVVAAQSRMGRLQEADASSRRLIEGVQTREQPPARRASAAYELRGIILFQRRQYDDSIDASSTAIEINERLFGPNHPSMVAPLQNMGGALLDSGRLDEAWDTLLRALEIGTRTYGSDHEIVSTIELNLGRIGVRQKQPDRALEHIGRACATYESLGATYEAALVDCFTVEAEARLLRSNDHTLAAAAVERALVVAKELGDTEAIERAERLLAQARSKD